MSIKDGIYKLKLGDKDVELKGNWDCVSKIEDDLGKGLISFYMNDMANMNVTISQIVIIYRAGLKAMGDSRLKADEVSQMILDDGIMVHIEKCMGFINQIVSGNGKESKSTKK